MKISTLILWLDGYLTEHGDIEAVWAGSNWGEPVQMDVDLDVVEREHSEDDEGPHPMVVAIGKTSPRMLDVANREALARETAG